MAEFATLKWMSRLVGTKGEVPIQLTKAARALRGLALCSALACGNSGSGGDGGSEAGDTTDTGSTTNDDESTESESGSTESTGEEDTDTDGGIKYDVGEELDIGSGECLACSIELATMQSGSLEPTNGNTFMGEALLMGNVVYALDEVGPGRVIYTADMTDIFYNEMTDCPLWEWLGDTPGELPRLLSTGGWMCDAQDWNHLGDYPNFTYSATLPAQYVGDAAALRADYDVVMYCNEENFNVAAFSNTEAQTYVDFATVEGGGLYLGHEYFDVAPSLDKLNQLALPLDVEFINMNLNWGDTSAEAGFDCFPVPEG